MAYSIEKKRKHLCNGEISLHVLDIITSIMKASKSGVNQSINTDCVKPKKFTNIDIRKIIRQSKDMIKPIVISDPYPRTLDLIFTKTKLKELKTKYKIIVAPKKNKNNFSFWRVYNWSS